MIKKVIIIFFIFFQRDLFSQSDSLKILFKSAEILYNKSDLKRSFLLCEKILSNHKDYFDAVILRGKIYYSLEKNKSAFSDFNYIIQKSNNQEDIRVAYYWRGQANFALNEYQLAANDYSKVIKYNPTKDGGYVLRANAFLMLNKIDSAYLDIRKAFAIKPDKSFISQKMAEVYIAKNQYDSAFICINQSINLDNNNIEALLLKSKLYRYSGDYTNGKRSAELAVKIDGKNNYAWYELAQQDLLLSDTKEAEEIGKLIIDRIPDYPSGYLVLGQVYMNNGDTLQALKYLDLSIEKGKYKYADAYFSKGMLYYRLNRPTLALKNFKTSIELGLLSENLYLYIADCAFQLKNYKEAEQYYKLAISSNTGNSMNYVSIGKLYFKIKKSDLALINYEKALRINPSDSAAFAELTSLKSSEKKYDEAIEICRTAIKIYSDAHDLKKETFFLFKEAYYLVIISKYKEALSVLENINADDITNQISIESLREIAYFGSGNIEKFKSIINSYNPEIIHSVYELFHDKLMVLLIDNKFDEWTDLFTDFCSQYPNNPNSFNYLQSQMGNDKTKSNEKKELIDNKYLLTKKTDSLTIFSISFIIDSTFKKEKYLPILISLDKKITQFPKKEIPVLIKAQLQANISDSDALNTFNLAISLNPKFYSAFYLRGLYKQNKLNDSKGARLDFETAENMKKELTK